MSVDDTIMKLRSVYKWIHRTWNPVQLVLIQEICFCLILTISTPVYSFTVNTHALLKVIGNNEGIFSSVRIPDFLKVLTMLEEKVQFSNDAAFFRNFMVFVVFVFALSSTASSHRTMNRKLRLPNIIILGIISWIVLCFFICLPIQFVFSSRLIGAMSFLRHPVSSLLSLIMFVTSLPFSIVATSPLSSYGDKLDGINQQLVQEIEGRITLPSNLPIQTLFSIYYNWRILIPLCMFLSSCYTLITYHVQKFDTQNEACQETENIIQSGSVRRISKNFENFEYRTSPPKAKVNKIKFVEEETIKPISCNLVTQCKPRSPVTLAKVRPMKVNKPTQHVESQSSFVMEPNFQDVGNKENKLGSDTKKKTMVDIGIQCISKRRVNSSSQTIFLSKDSEQQCEELVDDRRNIVEYKDTAIQYDVTLTNNSSTQSDFIETEDTAIQCDIPKIIHTSTQCDVVVTKETLTQCDAVVTKEALTQCEILSQERYIKLQQSALALYKKTVQPRDWSLTSPKKVHVSPSNIRFNKSVQVNLKYSEEEQATNGNLISNGCPKNEVNESLLNKEVQTELFGYVLDKVLQERETSNVYSKTDLERAVHSVLTLPEKVKQYTETIRFKAIKSQHGVWYVSLRGDVFLTVSQDVLKNFKLNVERKIETEISSDILRAMKMYVDNYNKLSDCFEDDDESDDESFINGFRL